MEKSFTPEIEQPNNTETTFSKGLITRGGTLDIELPEDNEELFQNFDKYIPDDFEPYLLATYPPKQIDKEVLKKLLEKDLYGATMDDVKKYSDKRLTKAEKNLDKHGSSDWESLEHDRAVKFSNSLESNSLETTLGMLESKIFHSHENSTITDELKPLISRLYAEIKKGEKTPDIKNEDLINFINESKEHYRDEDDSEEDVLRCDNIIKEIERGNITAAMEEVEISIGHIQSLRYRDGNGIYESVETKANDKESLIEVYGKNYLTKLKQLREYRAYLNKNNIENNTTNEEVNFDPAKNSVDNDQKRELKGEELYKLQIENNTYEGTKFLKGNLILFLDTLNSPHSSLRLSDLLSELDEVLENQGIDSSSIDIGEEDTNKKRVLEPLLKLKQELSSWKVFTPNKVGGFRDKIVNYLDSTFGLEEYSPKEGEKVNPKKHRGVAVESTDNEFMDKLVMEVKRPGYKTNESMWNYLQKYIERTRTKNDKKLREIKAKVSQAEFNRVHNKIQQWEKSHLYPEITRPANVVVFKHNK